MTLARRRVVWSGLATTLAILAVLVIFLPKAHADTPGNFSLQITPSPLVTTVKPGEATTLTLKIRNSGTAAENLKIEPRSFKFDSDTGQVELSDNAPAEITPWISFGHQTFTIQPGEWYSQTVKINLPKDTGFSYSFALVISRQSIPKATTGGRLIEGSVADFTLVNVDRPGATSQLSVVKFTSNRHLYEYLPSVLSVTFKNTGNTIIQPTGNIFIQRGATAATPLATLPVNDKASYILPGTSRTLTAQWANGFPVYETTTDDTGKSTTKLTWDWSHAKFSSLRFGHYTAQLVAVYDDGQGHDVPIHGTLTFWVFPWKLLLLLVIGLIIIWGLPIFIIYRLLKRRNNPREKRHEKK